MLDIALSDKTSKYDSELNKVVFMIERRKA